MSGEAASRARPGLPGRQAELAQAVLDLGKPVVVTLSSGRPLMVPWLFERADAVLATWFLGSEAGNAVGDVLSGRHNPTARLPVSWPVDVGQIPIFYAQRPTGRPADPTEHYTSKYLDLPVDPLFAFGHGLSYARFAYRDLRAAPAELRPGETITVEVEVANEGAVAGEETVFLFLRDPVASVARPLLELKGVAKIALERGRARHRPPHAVDRRPRVPGAATSRRASSPASSRSTSARAQPNSRCSRRRYALPRRPMPLDPLQPDWSALAPLGDLGPIERTAFGFRAATEAGPIEVAAYGRGILRLVLGTSSGPDFGILAAGPAPPRVDVVETELGVELRADDLRLALRRAPLRLTFARGEDVLLDSTTDGTFGEQLRLPPFARSADGWLAAFALESGEAVFGHGEKFGPLNHRGQLVRSRVEDGLGVNAEVSYKNTPFAWSPRGWGLFVHTAASVTHGVGHAPWSHRSYVLEVAEDALDLFLITGACPAALARALHLAHRAAAEAAPLEPRRLVFAGLLSGCRGGAGDGARAAGAQDPGRCHPARRSGLAGQPDPLPLRVRSGALSRPQGFPGRAARARFQGLCLGIPDGLAARAAVRRVRGQGMAAEGPGHRARRRARLGRGVA